MVKTNFKVGMKVYDEVNYPGVEGVVTGIRNVDAYPIIVSFRHENVAYKTDGVFFTSAIPTLSPTSYKVKLEGFTEPIELPEKGQVVWVRDFEDPVWIVKHFVEYDASREYRFMCSSNTNLSGVDNWKFLTTENPYLTK